MFVEAAYRFDKCQKYRIGGSNDKHSNIQLKRGSWEDNHDGDIGASIRNTEKPQNAGSTQGVAEKDAAD